MEYKNNINRYYTKMNTIPPSPVISSMKPTLLNIIGPDCYNIIEDYKNSIERYEQNFKDIDECVKEKDDRKCYKMTLNLEEFRDYYMKNNYKFNREFKIKIGEHTNMASYSLDYLKPMYLKYLNIKTLRYKEKYDSKPWLELYFGEYTKNDIGLIEKILIDTIFTYSPRQRYSGGCDPLYDKEYMEDFF